MRIRGACSSFRPKYYHFNKSIVSIKGLDIN
uniref:Uncharacterized protein n=1 Tax=Arundo donax TaxID=35708 RepID=A0A0A9FMX6_ARUDO